MSQPESIEAISSQFGTKLAVNAFTFAMGRLKISPKNAADYAEIKQTLSLAGFSQSGRNRITYLSAEEIDALYTHMPEDKKLLPSYVHEIQLILRKMDQVRKRESFLSRPSFMGRPYVTIQLASTIGKLATLRHLVENGIDSIFESKLYHFLMEQKETGHFDDFGDGIMEVETAGEIRGGKLISLRSCIQFMELYSDELITPPRLKSKSNFDEFDLHMVACGDLDWMDDGGEAYLEYIRDIPVVSHYDEMPSLDAALDWFLSTRPVFDHNQIKRGWAYVEKATEDWHHGIANGEIFDEDTSKYPSWNCIAADRHTEWNEIFPVENPYRIVPLNTPKQLLSESQNMHHCVLSYINRCVSGESRIFSVLDTSNDNHIATAELSNHYRRWNLVQLKGKSNAELICRMRNSSDPLAIALDILLKWYNENSPLQPITQTSYIAQGKKNEKN